MTKDMKRITAPRSWPVPRKTNYWIAKPSCNRRIQNWH
ncbi:MAG: hypothetical protein MUE65_03650 [Methanomassiliicoccales archaeon]|nr:hypothetical protein [Methanomassiliicoccales archaeon]